MMMGPTTDEMSLLERVYLRFASTDSDETLQAAVSKYLAPSLLKLNSQQEGVRKKVMELLVHINKRIKNNNKIILPVKALLVQYQDPSSTSFVTNFTIIYIKMGYPRLPIEEQLFLIPVILTSCDGKPESHQNSFFALILPLLGFIIPPETEDKKNGFLGLNDRQEIAKQFYSYLEDYLCLPYGSHPSYRTRNENGDEEPLKVPACMSELSWKRVAGAEGPISSEIVENNKISICKFLALGLISPMETAPLLIIALSDTRHKVTSLADSAMRQIHGAIDWNNTSLIATIYSLFLGTLVNKYKMNQVKPECRKTPANTRIRLKLMPYLLSSREAAIQFPSFIQVIFDLLFGAGDNSNDKLKTQSVAFIHHVIYNCPEQRLIAIGGVLLNALSRVVKNPEDNIPSKLRASAYIAIGKLGSKVPSLINKDINILRTFFEAIVTEDPETQLSVSEALSLMAGSFKKMNQNNIKFLDSLLATYIEKDCHQVRLVVVEYAGHVFEGTHINSRYILLLGSGDSHEDVANSSTSLLYGGPSKNLVLPDFEAMLDFILDKAAVRIKTHKKWTTGSHILAFSPKMYHQMLKYLQVCLLHQCGIQFELDDLRTPLKYAPLINRYLMTSTLNPLILKFIEFIIKLVEADVSIEALWCLLTIVGCTSDETHHLFIDKISWLKGLLSNAKDEIRETIGQLLSVILAHFDQISFENVIGDLVKSYKDKSLEYRHGIIVTLGYSFAQKLLVLQNSSQEEDVSNWSLYKDSICNIIIQPFIYKKDEHLYILNASCIALGEVARVESLPCDTATKLSLVQKLLELVTNNKMGMRVRERAAIALGHLCVGDPHFSHCQNIISGFLTSATDIKDVELHLTIGEAILHASLGTSSSMKRNLWRVTSEEFSFDSSHDHDHLNWLLNELITKHTKSNHPNMRQASSLWLLSLVKNALFAIQEKDLLRIQSAFMNLLGDKNELIQDAASKGLSLVYESSGSSQKEKMVESLVTTLIGDGMSTKKVVVTEDTKVFEDGELGKSPTGGNISTYKELCSLASDLNQPDLIYKFMNLANYNAAWNSRKGAAFGFSTIAIRAGKDLEPYLPKIVPKLFRYQFDPSPKIRESMKAIWTSLVGNESTKIIDKYLSSILQDLHFNLTSNQWRVRESCCSALVDVLRCRSLSETLDYVSLFWEDLFRVVDDIKESVRLEANKAMSSLSLTCVKMADPISQGNNASEKAVKVILPPLLEQGLQSHLSEVKSSALNTIIKITKSAGVLLKPHLTLLISSLLVSLSEWESKETNYLSARLANDVSVQEKLDSARIAMAKSSPAWNCISFVLQYIDDKTLETLVPKISDIIKNNVDLNTKGLTAHFVTTLIHQCPLDMQIYTGKLLTAFVRGLSDRNSTIRKCFASAIGHLVKTAKSVSLEKLFTKLQDWIMSETSVRAVALTFQAISTYNPDIMKNYASLCMPIAFLGMHAEKNESNLECIVIWEEVWNDGTPGMEGGIRLYIDEIVALLHQAMESRQWSMKAQGARTIKTLGDTNSFLSSDHKEKLLSLLLNGLVSRTWEGKETLLEALPSLLQSHILLEENKTTKQKDSVIYSLLLKEVSKNTESKYKRTAIKTAGLVFHQLQVNQFSAFYDTCKNYVSIEEEKSTEKKNDLELQSVIFEALGLSWPKDLNTQITYLPELLNIFEHHMASTTKTSQINIVNSLGYILQNLRISEYPEPQSALLVIARILSLALSVPKNTSLRTAALKTLEICIVLLKEEKVTPRLMTSVFYNEIESSLSDVIKDLSSDAATKSLARDLKNSLLSLLH